MLPKVIIHNEISLDGSVTGFEPDMGVYYQIALSYKPDIIFVGSDTVKAAKDQIPPEEESDFAKPAVRKDDNRPLWVIPDSRGKLKNILHFYRRMEFIKDIIVLISKKTPKAYIDYLNERHYIIISCGDNHINYRKAFEILYDMYHARIIVTDSGGILNNILIEQGLVDEISLLISPTLTGTGNPKLFRSLQLNKKNLTLESVKSEIVEKNLVLIVYKIK